MKPSIPITARALALAFAISGACMFFTACAGTEHRHNERVDRRGDRYEYRDERRTDRSDYHADRHYDRVDRRTDRRADRWD